MTIGVNCGPVAYSKLLKAEARFGETQQNFDIRRRPWQTVVVRWNAPWRWKATSHKWFGATVFRKWQKYSFPDLSQNKLNQNSSHAAIIATWHYPAHIQCRMHVASEMGWDLGKWKKPDGKWVNLNTFWISNPYSSRANHISHLSQRPGREQCPHGTSEWTLSASVRPRIFFCHIMDRKRTGRVLSLVFFGILNCAPAGNSV